MFRVRKPRVGMVLGRHAVFLVKGVFTWTWKASKFQFADVEPWQQRLHLGPRKLFEHFKTWA